MKCSFDTNIALYAFVDLADVRKTEVTRALLDKFVDGNECVLSTQVLKEFANVCTKRFRPGMTEDHLLTYLSELCRLEVVVVDDAIVRSAVRRHFTSLIGFYDSLIVEAALAGGAKVLYSEDLQHGMRFGSLQVINPFR